MARQFDLAKRARLLALLGTSTRLSIMRFLLDVRRAKVGDIAKKLGMSDSAISHQLAVLAEEKIVDYEKHGREVVYFVSKSGVGMLATKILRLLAQ